MLKEEEFLKLINSVTTAKTDSIRHILQLLIEKICMTLM